MVPVEVSRAVLEERLRGLETLLRAAERRDELLAAVAGALDVSEDDAAAVLDTRLSRLADGGLEQLREERDRLAERLAGRAGVVPVEPPPGDPELHRRRLRLLDAYLAAVDRRVEVIHAVGAAETPEAAARAVAELLGVDDDLGHAVGELRVRALSASEVAALRVERDEIAGRLG